MSVLYWLFEPNPPPAGDTLVWLSGLALFLFVGSLTVYVSRRGFFPKSQLAARVAQRLALISVLLSLLLLVLLGARYLNVMFIQMRFWLVLIGGLIVTYAFYVAYFVKVRYPPLRLAYDAEVKRQRYARPQRSAGGQRRSKNKRR